MRVYKPRFLRQLSKTMLVVQWQRGQRSAGIVNKKAFEPCEGHPVAFAAACSIDNSTGKIYRVYGRLNCRRIHVVPASGVERVFRAA